MRWKKLATTLFLGLLCTAFLSGQSLYELAQKEKERRAKLQGKTSKVVTNADLGSSGRTASVSSSSTQPAPKKQPAQPSTSPSSSNPRVVLSRSDQQRMERETTGGDQQRDQMDASEDSRQQDQGNASSSSLKYATEVLSATRRVNNPELALKMPDGQYAEIMYSGTLELSLSAQNGKGADFAIFARTSGSESAKSGGQEEGGISTASMTDMTVGFWYGVSALAKDGQWVILGRGNGDNSPDTFDLGDLSSTTKIRIVFQPSGTPGLAYTRLNNTEKDITFDIDAVSVLH